MNRITITNITRKDFQAKQIRILASQKEVFPDEQRGNPQIYDVTVTWDGHSYPCSYRIGSKDGKMRSGILRLQNGLAEAMGDWVGETLELERTRTTHYKIKPVGR